MRFLFALLVLMAALAPTARAVELPSIEIAGMDPPAGANVPRNAALYVHLRYRSELRIRAQVKGFFQGVEVTDGASWNPSPASAAGAGEAIAWLAFSKPAHLDELRVEVSDGSWRPLLVLKVPRNVAWTGMPGEPPRAEWVHRLSDAQQQATHDDIAAISSGPGAWFLGTFVMLSVPGYFVLQILFALRWSGGWRIAALLPLLLMIPAMGHAMFALAAESNLWPIVVILVAPFLFLYLVLAAVVKYIGRARWPATA